MRIINVYADKGGVGSTTTAAMLALVAHGPTRLYARTLDERNDLCAALGLPRPADDDTPVPVREGLKIVCGDPLDDDPFDYTQIISGHAAVTDDDRFCNVLVTRACYLALRKSVDINFSPDHAIVIVEPGRALSARDVKHAVGCEVTELVYCPTISRAVDAGLLSTRLPQAARTVLRPFLAEMEPA